MLSEVDNIMQIISNDNVKKYNKTLKGSYYIKESEISIFSKLKLFKTINAKISQKGNNVDKITNTNIQLKYNNQNMTELSMIKDKDYFIVKNDYISEDYIGFENKNLKILAQKFGIKNTELIPNKIKKIDIAELFSITQQEKNHIISKYISIFRNNIKNENYSKQVNKNKEDDTIIEYKMSISENESKNTLIEILNELYNDEISLRIISSKIEILDNESIYCNIDNIKEKIKEVISYIEFKETNEEDIISVTIYRNMHDIEKIELKFKDNRTISIQNDNKNNKIIIKQSNVKRQITNLNNLNNIANSVLDSINEITYSKNITNNNKNNVDINVIFDIGIDKVIFTYSYVEQIENFVDNIIDKNNIDYIDVENIDKEFYDKILGSYSSGVYS